MEANNFKEGTYVRFFHGRTSVEEEMDDWGTVGPVVGPVTVGFTYGTLTLVDEYGDNETDIIWNTTEGLVKIGDTYYGDFSVFSVTADQPMNRLDIPHYMDFNSFRRLNEPTLFQQIDAISRILKQCGNIQDNPETVYRQLENEERTFSRWVLTYHNGRISEKQLKEYEAKARAGVQKHFNKKLKGLTFKWDPQQYCILLNMDGQYKNSGLYVDEYGHGILAANENDLARSSKSHHVIIG